MPTYRAAWQDAPVCNAAQVLTASAPCVGPVSGNDSFAPRPAEWEARATVLHVNPDAPDGAAAVAVAEEAALKRKVKRGKLTARAAKLAARASNKGTAATAEDAASDDVVRTT